MTRKDWLLILLLITLIWLTDITLPGLLIFVAGGCAFTAIMTWYDLRQSRKKNQHAEKAGVHIPRS